MPPEENQNFGQTSFSGQSPADSRMPGFEGGIPGQQFAPQQPLPQQVFTPGSWSANPQPSQPPTPPPMINQSPSPPPQPLTPEDNKSKVSIVRLVMLVLILLVVLGGLGFGGWVLYRHFIPKPTPVVKTVAPTVTSAKQLCSQAGVAIICQDIKTGAATKYQPPHFIGTTYSILPSPDDTKLFIDTPADAVQEPTVGDKLYITDKNLNVIKQLPDEKTTEDYLGFDWTADSKSLVYAKRDMGADKQFGKGSLYTYNSDTGTTKKLAGSANYDFSVPQVSRDGTAVYTENNAGIANGTLSLAAVTLANGQVQAIASGSVMQKMQSFSTYAYSRVQNLFYISGVSAATQQPIFIIASLQATATGLQLNAVKVLDNGYAYAPLTSAADGMIVSRTQSGTTQYGLIKIDGSFTLLKVNPTTSAPFGLSTLLGAKAEADSTVLASDYLYEYVPAPDALQTFLSSLVKGSCPANLFNTVALLAQDGGNQAVLNFTSCGMGTTVTQYYSGSNGAYKKVLETPQSAAVPCATVQSLGLTKIIVPACTSGS